MTHNPTHRRKSIRLKGYDYSQAGLYFVTICTQNRENLFGEITNGEMMLNKAGMMIENIWQEIPNFHNDIQIHEYVIMPNHFHAIIEIKQPVGAESISAQSPHPKPTPPKRANMEFAPTLSSIVQTFKRYTTIEYIKMVKQNILSPFNKRIWQRNYWEHIIRNENGYNQISEYIKNNPAQWVNDELNMDSRSSEITVNEKSNMQKIHNSKQYDVSITEEYSVDHYYENIKDQG